jgi:hypothetical protein
MAIVSRIPFTLFNEKGLEEKKRYFRFDINALADFEQEVGMGFSQLMSSRAVFAATRALTWAGLKWQDRALTIQSVGELIQGYVTAGGSIDQVLGAAMRAAMDQGALGKAKPDDDFDDDEDVDVRGGSEGNAPQLPATGPSGSSEAAAPRLVSSNSDQTNSSD